jgi:hypothetical protein
MFSISMKMLADTQAHSILPVSSAGSLGQPFLGPFATVTLSGFDLACLNTTFQNQSGAQLDLGNTKVADLKYELKRYADATQNTAAITTPS